MIGTLLSEGLVAMTGIFPTHGPSELAVRGAATYQERIRRRLVRFLGAEQAEKIKWERPPVQADLWRDLNEEIDIEEMARWLDGLPMEIAAMYPTVISNARAYIKRAWPIYPEQTLGASVYELAQDEYGDVWQLARTLNDFETIFDDMDALVLLPSQVDAVAEVYPDLYEETTAAAMSLLKPYTSISGIAPAKKSLSYQREEQLRTLLRLPMDAPFIQPQEEQPKGAPKRADSTREMERRNTTQSERIADKAAAR
jgi:hypothetical protein